MKDQILGSYLADFASEKHLEDRPESEQFECFISHCVVAKDYPEPFDIETVRVGGGNDYGIDGLAVILNEHLVGSIEDIEYFRRQSRRFDVRFIFIQAKTSATFDSGDMQKFLYGVGRFFSASMDGPKANAHWRRLRNLKDKIYQHSIDMMDRPKLDLYYATCGKWNADAHLQEIVDHHKKQLEEKNLFSQVGFWPLDAETTKKLYRQLRRKTAQEIVFDKHTILPKIENVSEAYVGFLPASEYLKLISEEDGRLRRELFYDNVRDFQGYNPVNREIETTLENPSLRDKFVLLNNGITIVAQAIRKVGTAFTLLDYQIVNGCQTSHVIHRSKEATGALIPVKLIVTENADVTNLIIKGTNRQTAVQTEAFESLRPFQKELEEFYLTVGRKYDPRLYYERRSKQYDGVPIEKKHIISLPAQVASFVAMFLNEPHSTHRYYGELLDANRSRLFLDSHSRFPYFVSGYALMTIESLFNNQVLNRTWRSMRFQLITVFRLLASKTELLYLNERKKIDPYCEHLMSELANPSRARTLFMKALEIVESAIQRQGIDRREAERLKSFTSALLEETRPGQSEEPATTRRQIGRVKMFDDLRGFGFVEAQGFDRDLYVHFESIPGRYYLRPKETVEFTPDWDHQGRPRALDVQVVESI